MGWCPQTQPFLYPPPRDPATYNAHPKRPVDSRIHEMSIPYEDAKLASICQAHLRVPFEADFKTSIHTGGKPQVIRVAWCQSRSVLRRKYPLDIK